MRDVTYCYNDINDFGALYLSRKIRQRKSMSGGNLYVSEMNVNRFLGCTTIGGKCGVIRL